MLLSDAAKYMIAAGITLKSQYRKLFMRSTFIADMRSTFIAQLCYENQISL